MGKVGEKEKENAHVRFWLSYFHDVLSCGVRYLSGSVRSLLALSICLSPVCADHGLSSSRNDLCVLPSF